MGKVLKYEEYLEAKLVKKILSQPPVELPPGLDERIRDAIRLGGPAKVDADLPEKDSKILKFRPGNETVRRV